MLILNTTLTPALGSWLVQAGASGRSLVVRQVGSDIEVLGPDGSDLQPSEVVEVEALLAADAVETLHPLPR